MKLLTRPVTAPDGTGAVTVAGPYPHNKVRSVTFRDVSDHPHDTEIQKAGFVVNVLTAHDRRGRTVGTLRVQHMDDCSVRRAFPTVGRLLNHHAHLTYQEDVTDNEIWCRAAAAGMVRTDVNLAGGWDSLTAPERRVRDRQLAVTFGRLYREQWNADRTYFWDATVVYAEVDMRLRGCGVGSWMYETMAAHLGRCGKRLRESQTRSPSADGMWSKLEREGKAVRVKFRRYGQQSGSTFRTLDMVQ